MGVRFGDMQVSALMQCLAFRCSSSLYCAQRKKNVELDDDIRCLKLLMRISDMLATRSPLMADDLESATTEYHIRLYALYPDACKIKLHFVKHTPDDIRKWQRILTCFGPEAAHKFTNQVMLHAYKRSTYTATSYALHHAVSASQNPFTYREEYLSGMIRTFDDEDAELSLMWEAAPTLPVGFIPTQIRCSRCLVHSRRTFRTRQFI